MVLLDLVQSAHCFKASDICKMGRIQLLSDESVIQVLSYLRATDLGAVAQVDKTVFGCVNVARASSFLFAHTLAKTYIEVSRKNMELSELETSPVVLYMLEINCILSAIASPQSSNNKGSVE